MFQHGPGRAGTREPAAAHVAAAHDERARLSGGQPTSATTVLTGCVYKESDVPGRSPNVAERAGVMEDYILAEVKTGDSPSASASTASPTDPAAPRGTAGNTGAASSTAGTSGSAASAASAKMYKLERIEDERLRAVVGKRVEVTGRIDSEAGDATAREAAGAPPASETDRAIGRDRVNLAEFEVVSMREVEGTCPAAPSGR